jgi:hypothetical protein
MITVIIAWIAAHQWVLLSGVGLYEIIASYFPTVGKSKSLIYWIVQLIRFLIPDIVSKNNNKNQGDVKFKTTILGSKKTWV